MGGCMSRESNKNWKMTPLVVLGMIFVTLKLMGYIAWSWWWVTAPFWIVTAVLLIAAAVMTFIAGLVAISDHKRNRK
jgi:membrane protein YdbS with pleckstrin-like domain